MPEGTMMQSPALPHPEPGSAQLDQHRVKAELRAQSMGLAAFKASALHHINMALKIRQKQESCCSWIIGWHPLSLVLTTLIYKTRHLTQTPVPISLCSWCCALLFTLCYPPDEVYTAHLHNTKQTAV